jgi:hypothetical protein
MNRLDFGRLLRFLDIFGVFMANAGRVTTYLKKRPPVLSTLMNDFEKKCRQRGKTPFA